METPNCRYGYTEDQLKSILGERFDDFKRWMVGQTMAICDGREWDEGTKSHKPSGCGPHGEVTYICDLEQFLAGLKPLD